MLDRHTVERMFGEISENLENKWPKFRMVLENSQDLYKLKTLAIRKKDQICFFLNIPITSWTESFDLYEVETFPIPMPNTNHTTSIENLPNYILISKDRKWLVEFNERPDIEGNLLTADFMQVQKRYWVMRGSNFSKSFDKYKGILSPYTYPG